MMLVMEINGGGVFKRLVRPSEIVFNEPFSQLLIEDGAVCSVVAKRNEFFFERSVESFIEWIVGWRFGTRKVMGKMKILHGIPEVFGKLRAIVSLHVFHLPFKEIVYSSKEIGGMLGMFCCIHPGEGNLGINIDAGENVSAHTRSHHGNAVKRN